MIVSRITKYAIEILLRNKNRKDQGQYQCFFDLERQERMYNGEMKANERTKEIHIRQKEKEDKRIYVYNS